MDKFRSSAVNYIEPLVDFSTDDQKNHSDTYDQDDNNTYDQDPDYNYSPPEEDQRPPWSDSDFSD